MQNIVFVFVPIGLIHSSTCSTPATPTPTANFPVSKTPNHLATLCSFSFTNSNPDPNPRHSYFSLCCRARRHHHRHVLYCSSPNKLDSAFLSPNPVDDDDDDDVGIKVDDDDIESEDIIEIEIDKTGTNCRRIRSEIRIEASLNTVWNLLTDYERLADFIPGLAVCRLLHKTHNYARLFQIGQQNLPFGLKFNAQGVVDCYETPLESLPNSGLKREIEFNMVEGDFEIFQGKWSLQQLISTSTDQQEKHTSLSYLVDVRPKLWLPVRLVEGRLCKEIKTNLACIRQQALKTTHNNTTL